MKLSDYCLEIYLLFFSLIFPKGSVAVLFGYLLTKSFVIGIRYPLFRMYTKRTYFISPTNMEFISLFPSHILWVISYTLLILFFISKIIGLFQPYTLQMLLNNHFLTAASVCIAGLTYNIIMKSFSAHLRIYNE